jgi:hypothetical protein
MLKFAGCADILTTEAEAASATGKLMAELVPAGQGVIKELTIEMRKSSVPTLDLIDLPGIVAASIEGEPADMMSRTRAITKRYIREPDTIIVVVVPANITRVRDSQAIQLVQKCGKEAVTLGVLAKADLAHDPRYKQRKQPSPFWELSKRLAGEADDMVSLPNGWIAVENRDTLVEEEEAAGLASSAHSEREWFRGGEVNLPEHIAREHCGLDALLTRVDGLYTKHIKQTWVPQALEHLQDETKLIDRKIRALGPPPSSISLEAILAHVGETLEGASACAIFERDVLTGTQQIIRKSGVQQIVRESELKNQDFDDQDVDSDARRHRQPPSINNILAKVNSEKCLIAALPQLVQICSRAAQQAVEHAFQARRHVAESHASASRCCATRSARTWTT